MFNGAEVRHDAAGHHVALVWVVTISAGCAGGAPTTASSAVWASSTPGRHHLLSPTLKAFWFLAVALLVGLSFLVAELAVGEVFLSSGAYCTNGPLSGGADATREQPGFIHKLWMAGLETWRQLWARCWRWCWALALALPANKG
jgi:hypothetical protein